MDRNNNLQKGMKQPGQINSGTLRYDARLAYEMLNQQRKPDRGIYKTPGRGAQGESSN
jgi:hypothetical protein